MYVAVLLFVYYLWEADAKEEEKGLSSNKLFEFFIGLHRCCQHPCQQHHRSHYMILSKQIIFYRFLNSSKARAKGTTERIDTTLETITNLESRLGHVKSTNDDLEKLLRASQDDNRLLHANLSRLISDLKMTKQSNK